jgi:hypothetical protein
MLNEINERDFLKLLHEGSEQTVLTMISMPHCHKCEAVKKDYSILYSDHPNLAFNELIFSTQMNDLLNDTVFTGLSLSSSPSFILTFKNEEGRNVIYKMSVKPNTTINDVKLFIKSFVDKTFNEGSIITVENRR